MQLGIVDTSGIVRFKSADIQEARTFLRNHGLECERSGWQGAGKLGVLTFLAGEWHAACWNSKLAAS